MASIRRIAVPLMGLVSLSTAYDGKDDSASVGDTAPYGIPEQDFNMAIGQANATGLFTIPGYNLSSPADKQMASTRDWTIHVSLRGAVPLSGANDSDMDENIGDKYTQLTSFSIDAPEPSIIQNKVDSNKLCAAIGYGFNSNTTSHGQSDAADGGECGFLSSECKNDLKKAANNGGASCDKIKIPDSCVDYFPRDAGMSSFEMTAEILGQNRFFSFGSEPTSKNNKTEYDIAVTNIWPVLFSWHHGSAPKDSSTSTLVCMRPNMVAYDSRKPDGVPDRGDAGEDDDEQSNKSESGSSGNSKSTDDDDSAAVRGAGSAIAAGILAVGLTSLFTLL